MKPALPWTIALGGLLLLAGAMAWATRSLVGMERTQHRMAAEAAVQERSRLALWRMESIAAALVVGESARPPDQYRAGSGAAPPLSPASRIRLHFELDADGRVRSPQVAEGPGKPPVPGESGMRLQELRARLAEKAGPEQWVLLGQAVRRPQDLTNNSEWLSAANALPPPAPVAGAVQLLAMESSLPVLTPEYAPPQLPSALKPAEAKQEQDFNNQKEADMRQRAVGDLARIATSQTRQLEEGKSQAKTKSIANRDSLRSAQARKTSAVRQESSGASQGASSGVSGAAEKLDSETPEMAATANRHLADAAVPAAPGAPAPASAPAPLSPREDLPVDAASAGMVSEAGSAAPASAPPAAIVRVPEAEARDADAPPPVTISDFRALWIKDALLLTRRVSQDGTALIQGAWVDWPQLRADLLAAVSDLFPAAGLEAAPSGTSGGTDLLASLPIRFLPGYLEIPASPFWSPLKLSLATAWACVLLASAAVALVLRGMMTLSERRATFVSAVTHELRTPLATFKLYSEMLADGLVRDPAKRQSYLETLTTEADRLGHLVENVLSYSRLERGKASDGRIRTTLEDLLQRVEPRLHQRTAQAGAEFSIDRTFCQDEFSLTTDPAAVEQILFNLVDNACKYGRRGTDPAQLQLAISPARNGLQLAVRDHGPGLTRAEARKLFRPFHKSAREAAHSAPGVGLGLALCRRLARDLGGTLEIDHAWAHGASFVLTLPA